MKDQWIGANINLAQLCEGLRQFFIENQFETRIEQKNDGYKIEAATKEDSNVQFKVTVNVYGHSNDFTVEFLPNKKARGFSSLAMIIGYITPFVGGGSFLLKGLKFQEALNKLEDEFWNHVDKQVAELTKSQP